MYRTHIHESAQKFSGICLYALSMATFLKEKYDTVPDKLFDSEYARTSLLLLLLLLVSSVK